MGLKTKKNLQYMVGGLLYMPAFQTNIVKKIQENSISNLTSVAFCLEDAIQDTSVEDAERVLKGILHELKVFYEQRKDKGPLLFVRVRTPRHMQHVIALLAEDASVLTGYILPKFDLQNATTYLQIIQALNEKQSKQFYIMPILESKMIADMSCRAQVLMEIKRVLDSVASDVLNIRVGGNDFSNLYGLRRSVNQTIYSVGVVSNILLDILNVFGQEYVVSGPAWNYFGEDTSAPWAAGLCKELELDRLNGFVGKTAIHLSQLPYIYDSLRVDPLDYADAKAILHWDDMAQAGVKKSVDGSRMNEVKTHFHWAERIMKLSRIYGLRNGEGNQCVSGSTNGLVRHII